MKFLERFTLTIFSIIILTLSVILLLIMFELAEVNIITNTVSRVLEDVIAYRSVLTICIVCILLALKCLLFRSKKEDLGKDGIILENTSGKLVISKESLENLVASVAKDIPGAESVSSKTILDKDRNLKVFVTTTVTRDIMLKEVSTQLQAKIKEIMKNTADLEVKEVNIKIKKIITKKSKKAEERIDNSVTTAIETDMLEEQNDKKLDREE